MTVRRQANYLARCGPPRTISFPANGDDPRGCSAITIVDGQWPGKDLLDIRYLNGKALIRVNNRHPFMSEIVGPLKSMAAVEADEHGSLGFVKVKMTPRLAPLLFVPWCRCPATLAFPLDRPSEYGRSMKSTL